VSALVGIVDLGGVHLAPNPIQGHRSSGLTLQPNYLGLGSVMGLPATLLWLGRSRRWAIAGWAGVGILLGGVFVSGSRAGAGGALLAIGITVLLVPRLRHLAALVFPLCGMAIILMLMLTSVDLHQTRLGNSLVTYQSDAGRSQLHQIALSQFEARPLSGIGIGVIEDAHDIYLQLLAAGGVIALTSFLVYLAGLAGAARRSVQGPLRDETLVVSVGIVAWLLSGPFENQLADKFLYVLPGLLYAMSLVTRKEAVGWARTPPLADRLLSPTVQYQRIHRKWANIRRSRSRTSSTA
jgi:O-antigen ligase